MVEMRGVRYPHSMRIRNLHIEHFRGVKLLDWSPADGIACIVGPGNSAKTTILDAIELTLLPRWFAGLSDDDFFHGDTSTPIKIEVTVGDLPKTLLRDDSLGHHLRGWSEENGLQDEPGDGLSAVVTVRFTLDSSLEPLWHVVNDRIPDGVPIAMRDREKLGVARLGNDVDRQLTWMRGSALPRLATGSGDAGEAISSAVRAARTAFQNATLPDQFAQAATAAHDAATQFGAAPAAPYAPRLGGAASINVGAMELFEGAVPARMAGLGSRRLAALAIQAAAVREGAILLIDEIEAGLEPHRIGTVLRKIKDSAAKQGHTILTSHSPVVLRELDAQDLCVARRTNAGQVSVSRVPSDLQDLVRSVPGALLVGRIALLEGKTEHGVISHFVSKWEVGRHEPLAHRNAAVVTGSGSGGSAASAHAMKLRMLGYDVALFADSDTTTTPSDVDLLAAGVTVIRWADACNTETRVTRDVPETALQAIVNFGVAMKDEPSIRAAFADRFGASGITVKISDWVASGISMDVIRAAIGTVAAKGKVPWFKNVERGRALGRILDSCWDDLQETDTRRKIEELEAWFYG